MKIGCDVDETIVNIVEPMLLLHNKRYCTNYSRSELYDYEFSILNRSREEIISLFKALSEEGYIRKLELIDEDCPNVMKRLVGNGNIIDLITATISANFKDKKARLDELGVSYNKIITVDLMPDSKAVYAKNYDLFIDDNPHQCRAIKEAGCEVIVYNQPWNRELKDFKRAYNWKDVEKIVNCLT